MNRFGLIGRNISYSFSENYFEQKFKTEKIEDCNYSIFDLDEISDVKKLFEIRELKGLNVTIPYKEKIIPFLDELSSESKTIGAVNCIGIDNGIKTGYNTDAFGFENSLKTFLDDFDLNALILGDGGAAKAVKFVLNQMDISFKTVSRKGGNNYSDLNETEIKNHRLIINCTPLGAFPNLDSKPQIPYQFLTSDHYLFDLVYNPEKTEFLKSGEDRGSKIKNGYEMLQLQAEKSWEIWSALL
ncbi:MAG: shikimate dehydrogenase [Moheibacter sp.]